MIIRKSSGPSLRQKKTDLSYILSALERILFYFPLLQIGPVGGDEVILRL